MPLALMLAFYHTLLASSITSSKFRLPPRIIHIELIGLKLTPLLQQKRIKIVHRNYSETLQADRGVFRGDLAPVASLEVKKICTNTERENKFYAKI